MNDLLTQYTQASERQLALKEMLEKQYIELMREKSLKTDILDIHLKKINSKANPK
jgi:hypothetical protein